MIVDWESHDVVSGRRLRKQFDKRSIYVVGLLPHEVGANKRFVLVRLEGFSDKERGQTSEVMSADEMADYLTANRLFPEEFLAYEHKEDVKS